jgi:hypothetical protein
MVVVENRDIAAQEVQHNAGMTKCALLFAVAFVAGCGSNKAAETSPSGPGFKDIILTDEEDGKTGKATFAKDTMRIYAYFNLEGVGMGTKIKGTWICEKSEVAEPNFKIDDMSLPVVPPMNSGSFSISRPNAGWPVGEYRVDMSMDGVVKDSVKFAIK